MGDIRRVQVKGIELDVDVGEMLRAFERRSIDINYFSANYRTLQEQYPEEWVAILNEQIVGHHKRFVGLVQLLNESGIHGEYIEKVYVKEKPPVFILPAA